MIKYRKGGHLKRINNLSASIVVLALSMSVISVPSVFAATQKPDDSATRIAANKLKYAAKLTKVQEAKLKTTCKPAQAKVKLLNDKAIKNHNIRDKAYATVGAELSKIIPRLKDADVDTTDLSQYQTQLTALIMTYSTDTLAFANSLQDTAELDCLTDPAAFKSSLDAARAERLKLVTSSKAVATYVTETIKPGLQKISTELQANDGGAE